MSQISRLRYVYGPSSTAHRQAPNMKVDTAEVDVKAINSRHVLSFTWALSYGYN